MNKKLHKTQEKILLLAETQDISKLSLRDIGALVGEQHPQTVKYHVNQLQKKGLVDLTNKNAGNVYKKFKQFSTNSSVSLVNIPILGEVNCGRATLIADERPEGFVKVSTSITRGRNDLFALKAVGNSMNEAKIRGQGIQEGDYLLVDGSRHSAKDGEYVISIIEGCANAKRYYFDKDLNRIVLLSESSESFEPIIIDSSDADSYLIAGIVFDVVKKVV